MKRPRLKSFLKYFFGTLASLLVLVMLFVLMVWSKPEFFARPHWIRDYVVKHGILERLDWESFDLKTEMTSFWGKRITLRAVKLCVAYVSAGLDSSGCLDELAIDVEMSLNPWRLRMTRVIEARLVARDPITLTLRDTVDEPKPEEPAIPTNLRTLYQDNYRLVARHLFQEIPAVHLEVGDFALKMPTGDVRASLLADAAGGRAWKLDANAKGTVAGQALVAKIGLDVEEAGALKLDLDGDWKKNLGGTLRAKLRPELFALRLRADGPMLPRLLEGPVELDLDLKEAGFDLRADPKARIAVLDRMLKVRSQGCKGQGRFIDSAPVLRVQLACPVLISYPFELGPLDVPMKNELTADVSEILDEKAFIEFSYLLGHSTQPLLIDLRTKAKLQFSAPTDEWVSDIIEAASFKFHVRDWNAWTARVPLRYRVLPAPLNAMNGSMLVEIRDTKDRAAWKHALVDVNFSGENQALSFLATTDLPVSGLAGQTRVKDMQVGFELRKLALTMPNWGLRDAQPKLMPDSRFVTEADLVKEELKTRVAKARRQGTRRPPKEPFALDLDLAASQATPVRLKTSLLDEPLRFYFDFDIREGGIEKGFIHVLPLTTKLFRRTIALQHMRVNFSGPEDDPTVNGVIHFPLPEYLVKLHVRGDMGDPVVYLESVPPLPEDDIYSVLIFGRPMDDLQTEQKDSMAQAQEAMTKGFFSLTSLYFFGGTPIESVGYDPQTGQVSAQFRLSNKNSVKVGGTGQSLNEVSLRRSLGKGWYIQGTVKDEGEADESFSTSVEKVIKY